MRDNSDLKVWFREDIAKVLMGVNAASRTTQNVGPHADAFRDGFVAALASVGLVFGVKPDGFLMPDDVELIQRRMNQLGPGA